PYGTSMPQSGRRPQHQSRHFGRRPTTSGLPLETDMVRVGRHVSKVPDADMKRIPAKVRTGLLLRS
ncbi:hypothetical protein, partial [Bradyrhizobium sp. sGM-13]|uniref:hypothetical protein n=1 Tax=Bradyrhizobium sp. sGM-13 TaxID=2831781 RepID=UPI001BCAC544